MSPPLLVRVTRALLEAVLRRGSPGPVFDPATFAWTAEIERRAPGMRAEALSVLRHRDRIVPFAAVLPGQRALTQGDAWRSYFLVAVREPVPEHAAVCPNTMAALAGIPGVLNAFYSIMAPGTTVPPHRGPYAGVLRLHVGLIVPPGDCAIRVEDTVLRWEEGRCLVFDDSAQHEVWNRTAGDRVVLFVDFVRPLPGPLAALNLALLGLMAKTRLAGDARAIVETTQIPRDD